MSSMSRCVRCLAWALVLTSVTAQAKERFLAPRTPAVADGATTLAGHASNGTARVIKVVTDMGFDDWGAFAVLKAAGNEPLAALVTKGMMQPSDFGPNFASLLASWDFSTTVHMGTDKCFDPPCANTSFIEDEWQYPDHVKDYFKTNATGPANRVGTVQSEEDFWDCAETGVYTLLVLSPISDVAIWLSKNEAAAECIEQIVFSGGFFNTTDEGSEVKTEDLSTYGALMATLDDPNLTSPESDSRAELNVVADKDAMDFILNFGINITMIPIEVESIDRVGKEADPSNETNLTKEKTNELRDSLPQEGDAAMLQRLADLHVAGGETATLDLDAIVATYLTSWNSLFTTQGAKVKVLKNGVTFKCDDDDSSCVNVALAKNFNATGWYEQMKSLR